VQGYPTVCAVYYALSRSDSDSRLAGYNSNLDKKSYSYTITKATYGDVVGGIWDDFIGADIVLFFGTDTGYVFAVKDSGSAFLDCVTPFRPSIGGKTCVEVTAQVLFDGSKLHIPCRTTGGTPDPDYGIMVVNMPVSCPGSPVIDKFIATENPVLTPLSWVQAGSVTYLYSGTKKGPKNSANSYIERIDAGAGNVANSDILEFDIVPATTTLWNELFTGSFDDPNTPGTNEAKIIARKTVDTYFCKAYCNTNGGSCGTNCSSTENNDGPFNDRTRSSLGSIQVMWIRPGEPVDTNANEEVYVFDKNGKCWGYNLLNGKNGGNIDAYRKWGANIDQTFVTVSSCAEGFTSSPIMVGTDLYVGDGCGNVYRIDTTTQTSTIIAYLGNQKIYDLSYDWTNLYAGTSRARMYAITPP
ncbi:MAG: PQQ-binding-like beta-propeller repeat protein, partial [Planctomycetota bacterium]